jgi:hypothetical protein
VAATGDESEVFTDNDGISPGVGSVDATRTTRLMGRTTIGGLADGDEVVDIDGTVAAITGVNGGVALLFSTIDDNTVVGEAAVAVVVVVATALVDIAALDDGAIVAVADVAGGC